MSRPIISAFTQAPRRCFVKLIELYQSTWSRWAGTRCRFHPSCSEYAKQALIEHGALLGLAYTVKRLLKCQPLHRGGIDPVPKKANKKVK